MRYEWILTLAGDLQYAIIGVPIILEQLLFTRILTYNAFKETKRDKKRSSWGIEPGKGNSLPFFA
jgi:hypothetical protein